MKITDDMSFIEIAVGNCARCGEDHAHLRFKRFAQPIEDADGTIWQLWALCPVSSDPILLKYEQTNDDN